MFSSGASYLWQIRGLRLLPPPAVIPCIPVPRESPQSRNAPLFKPSSYPAKPGLVSYKKVSCYPRRTLLAMFPLKNEFLAVALSIKNYNRRRIRLTFSASSATLRLPSEAWMLTVFSALQFPFAGNVLTAFLFPVTLRCRDDSLLKCFLSRECPHSTVVWPREFRPGA